MALGAPVMAQTDSVFAEFEVRCLTPMIEVRDPDVTGLILNQEFAGREKWVPASGDWWLLRPVVAEDMGFCAVHGDFGEEVALWAAAAVASGDYVWLDRDRETLRSVFLREPRIDVEIDRAATPMRLTVIETNLES